MELQSELESELGVEVAVGDGDGETETESESELGAGSRRWAPTDWQTHFEKGQHEIPWESLTLLLLVGLVWPGLVWSGLVWVDLAWLALVLFGPTRRDAGSAWFGLA